MIYELYGRLQYTVSLDISHAISHLTHYRPSSATLAHLPKPKSSHLCHFTHTQPSHRRSVGLHTLNHLTIPPSYLAHCQRRLRSVTPCPLLYPQPFHGRLYIPAITSRIIHTPPSQVLLDISLTSNNLTGTNCLKPSQTSSQPSYAEQSLQR